MVKLTINFRQRAKVRFSGILKKEYMHPAFFLKKIVLGIIIKLFHWDRLFIGDK